MPGHWVGSDRSARLPSNWDEICAEVWERDGDTCHLCGQAGADTIDHKQPGDNHHPSNLGPVHDRNPPHCHRRKSSAEGNAARAALRAQLRTPTEPHPGLLG